MIVCGDPLRDRQAQMPELADANARGGFLWMNYAGGLLPTQKPF